MKPEEVAADKSMCAADCLCEQDRQMEVRRDEALQADEQEIE